MKTELFKKDAKNNVIKWSIKIQGDVLVIEHGKLNGAIQNKIEHVPFGKAGRSLEEQLIARMNSRINDKMKVGYQRHIDFLHHSDKNSLGLLRPMLAKVYNDNAKIDWENSYVQRKYNGHRCLIHNWDSQMIAYSRGGKIIESIEHIKPHLNFPEGETVDGELYIHGMSLQKISSLVRRVQPDSEKLVFIAYDMIKNIPFIQRNKHLSEINATNSESIKIAMCHRVRSYPQLEDYFRQFKQENYEGLMLRTGNLNYEPGKRSDQLWKVKSEMSDEFKVKDIFLSEDGIPMLECELPHGATFKVTAPGTYAEKYHVFYNKSNYIGKKITVEYSELTENGTPFHGVATFWWIDCDVL